MARIPPENPLDRSLEDAVADAVAADLIDGNVVVLDRRDLARRAALDGFRQGIAMPFAAPQLAIHGHFGPAGREAHRL
jgi:hypothetical protein